MEEVVPIGGVALAPQPIAGNVRRRRQIPENVQTFFVPLTVIETTARVMRRFGQERRECYVWWSGYFNAEGTGQVLTAIHPEMHTEYGHIHLDREQMGILQEELRRLDQVLLIELHTHPPGAGGQNEVDAAHPAAPYPGFISIVVPDFGNVNLANLSDTYVYEYMGGSEWRELEADEVDTRFVVDQTDVPVHFDE